MNAFRFLARAVSLACLVVLVVAPVRAASLDDPGAAGLRHLGGGVYGAPGLAPGEVATLKRMVEHAKRRVALFYGAVSAAPNVIFCGSDDCYREFGGFGLGFSEGNHVLISPRGRRPAIVAHELAHVELAARVGGMARVLEIVPQWFDEGQAVMVSMAAEFSDEEWMEATAHGRAAPALNDLADMDQWVERTGRNGENMQMTYGTARREVSRWFAVVGSDGLADLLTALETREAFAAAYARIEALHRDTALAGRGGEGVEAASRATDSQSQAFSPTRLPGQAAW